MHPCGSTCFDHRTACHHSAAGRIIIMAGGGITSGNVREVVAATGVGEVHLSARKAVESRMRYRNENCAIGGSAPSSEYTWKTTDLTTVRAVVAALER